MQEHVFFTVQGFPYKSAVFLRIAEAHGSVTMTGAATRQPLVAGGSSSELEPLAEMSFVLAALKVGTFVGRGRCEGSPWIALTRKRSLAGVPFRISQDTTETTASHQGLRPGEWLSIQR